MGCGKERGVQQWRETLTLMLCPSKQCWVLSACRQAIQPSSQKPDYYYYYPDSQAAVHDCNSNDEDPDRTSDTCRQPFPALRLPQLQSQFSPLPSPAPGLSERLQAAELGCQLRCIITYLGTQRKNLIHICVSSIGSSSFTKKMSLLVYPLKAVFVL